MEADAEHQQNDADFRKFGRQLLVGHDARRIGAEHHAGENVTDDGRKPQPVGDRAENEGKTKAGDESGNQRCVMRHSGFQFPSLLRCG